MANIYDMNAALRPVNVVGNFQQGLEIGRANRAAAFAQQDQQRLRELAPQVVSGDENAYSQAAAINPDQANAYQQAGDDQLRRLRGAMTYLDQQTDPRAKQAAYQTAVKPFLVRMAGDHGSLVPDDVTQATEGLNNIRAKLSTLAPGQTHVLTPGSDYVDQSGNVLHSVPLADKIINKAPVGPNGELGVIAVNPRSGGQGSIVSLGGAPSASPASGSFFDNVNSLASKYGAQITSGVRTPEHNAAVGGVPNSQHLTGTAADVVIPPDQKQQFINDAKAQGLQPIDEGDHVHLQNPSGGAGVSGVHMAVGTPAPKGNSWQQRIDAAKSLGASDEQVKGMLLGASGMNNAQSSDLTPAALENASWAYILDGKLPPVGRGGQGQAQRTAIMNHAADISEASGVSPSQMVTRQGQQKALQGSLNAYQKRADAMAGQENSFLNNLAYAEKISESIDRTRSPAINRWLLTGQEQAGDPDVVKLKAALTPVAADYAKIMSGATGAGGTPVSTMQEALEMIRTDLSKQQFSAVSDVLRSDVHNQRLGSLQQLHAIRDNLSRFGNGTQGGSSAAQTPAEEMGGHAPSAPSQGIHPDDQALLNKYLGGR